MFALRKADSIYYTDLMHVVMIEINKKQVRLLRTVFLGHQYSSTRLVLIERPAIEEFFRKHVK